MHITEIEKNEILKDFPNIELSYENIIHKKVYDADFIMAIPEGKKCFAWFTIFKNQNVCFIIDISENNQYSRVEIVPCCFHSRLSYGTIFLGTIFKYNNVQFFSIEDIYYHNGVNINKELFVKKLGFLKNIFLSEIKQIAYSDNQIVFGLPLISTSFQDLLSKINLLHYKIKKFHFLKKREIMTMNYTKQNPNNWNVSKNPNPNHPFQNKNPLMNEIVFKIKPDIQNDIYHLFTYDDPENSVGIAYISNYEKSVMMNKLFRNIKENQNLDALEESDDEEEFENDKIDKFVYLDKSYNMLCSYNTKFRKWEPLRIAQKNERIITIKQFFCLEKNNH